MCQHIARFNDLLRASLIISESVSSMPTQLTPHQGTLNAKHIYCHWCTATYKCSNIITHFALK